jgi:serine/threonine protein kinase
MSALPDYIQIQNCGPGHDLKLVFPAASSDLLALIAHCLQFDPLRRWTTTQALQSEYFQTQPYACDDAELPVAAGRRKRKQQQTSIRENVLDGEEPPFSRRRLEF